MNQDSTIINKIKKCLALASSSNPNEAAIALRQAKKLMALYGFSFEDINNLQSGDIQELDFMTVKGKSSTPKYLAVLANYCAKTFNCEAFEFPFIENGKVVQKMKFIGLKGYPDVAKYCLDYLLLQLDASLKEFKRRSPTTPKLINDFRMGWISSVIQKLRALEDVYNDKEEETLIKANNNDLMVISNQIKKYVSSKYNLCSIKLRATNHSKNAYEAGKESGNKVNIRQPINNSQSSAFIAIKN